LDLGLAVGGVLGKAWNAPCAPTHSTRDALAITAETLGAKLRNSALPALDARSERSVLAPLARTDRDAFPTGSALPGDASRFAAAFWPATPFETRVPEAALAFRDELTRWR
jgi:hypothetical protein